MIRLTPSEEYELLREVIVLNKKERLVQQYWNLVYHIVSKTLTRKRIAFLRDDIEELRNEVFVRLFDRDCRRLRQFREKGGLNLSGWIILVTSTTVLDCLKKKDPVGVGRRDKRLSLEDEPFFAVQDDGLKSMENRISFKEALNKLPPVYQEVIKMYCSGSSMPEIATKINKSPIAATTIKSRALKRLKNLIDKENIHK